MNPLLYWVLFGLLLVLLVIFLSYIILNIFLEHCLTQPEVSELKKSYCEKNEAEASRRLNNYKFDRHDVEDLTRMQGDFKTVLPRVSFVNEVDDSNVGRLLMIKDSTLGTVGTSLANIEEEDGSVETNPTTDELKNNDFKRKKEISQSVDDLEFCDPRGIDVLKGINKIEEDARKVEKELDYFIGGTNNVKFYELNEKFLRLMIELCDVMCETSDLKKRKTEILEYIEECQRKLKQRAVSTM